MELSIEVERAIFRIGNGSFAVTLPIGWVRHHRLVPGDKVEIIADDELRIRAVTKDAPQDSPQERTKQAFYRLRFLILARDKFRCRYCGRSPEEDGVKLAVDRIVPVSEGGTNDPGNLITSCADCCRGKGDRLQVTSINIPSPSNKDLTDK